MKRLLSTYTFLTIACVVFLVSTIIPIFLYVRIYQAVAYVSRVEGDLASEGTQEKKARVAKQQVERTVQDRALLTTLSVGKGDVATFISSIEAKARASHVGLEIGSVGIDQTAEDPKPLMIQMKADGTQASALTFLRLIETLPVASYVRTVSLEKREKSWAMTATLIAPTQQ